MLEVLSALDGYWNEVQSSDLGEFAKSVYWQKAEYFVRWLEGEFVPGSRKAPYRRDRVATFQTFRQKPSKTEGPE
jgi:hypothetical protein